MFCSAHFKPSLSLDYCHYITLMDTMGLMYNIMDIIFKL